MTRTRGVTISSVAEASGVSVATVSRVMNDSPTVAPQLAERVRESAARLGYRPNASAQGLARGRTGMIGVLLPDLANPYFHEVMKGLTAEAVADGYHTLVAASDEVAEEEMGLAHELLRQTDGLVLCSSRMPRGDLMEVLDAGRPVVSVNRQVSGLALPAVTVDSRRGMLAVCGQLARQGHQRVTYLSGPELSWSNRERCRALSESTAFGLTPSTVACGSTMDDGYCATDAALEHHPTAIIAFNDIVAFGALARLRECGIAVPDEVSIAGFDDIAFAAYASPALTTVRNPKEQLGRHAWRMLVRLLNGERGLEPQVLVPELVVRGSTGPASQ
ncbi:MAG: LacI family transcriptional regulator, partial [Actinomycetota bacterium]|nr:LacI family transcriptional regulator [Actinomycetota bacterium]